MEVLAVMVVPAPTAAEGVLLTSPIPAIGYLTTLITLTLEVRGREVRRARIAREGRRGSGAIRELAEVILVALIKQEELSAAVQMVSRGPIAWIREVKVALEGKKAWASSIRLRIPQIAPHQAVAVKADAQTEPMMSVIFSAAMSAFVMTGFVHTRLRF